MARKVFFSFHYERDVWRVSQVRNSQNIQSAYDETQFLDAAHWEQVKQQGDGAIKKWIDTQLEGTSCTIVLIGNQTSERQWVKYEIEKSWERGNGVFGIYIHNINNQRNEVDRQGNNPFQIVSLTNRWGQSYYPQTYNWVNDSGRQNAGLWIDRAIRDRS